MIDQSEEAEEAMKTPAIETLQAVVEERLQDPYRPPTVEDFVKLMTALEDALREPVPQEPDTKE